MKIERLRLLGFKSFVEPTELHIEPGLTGVLGPNGCGKSNLLEALRWVMGETSYKSMRGSSMEDVIFSGTDTRPKRNIAEVTMFLDNSEHKAPAEFNDSDSIEVTRRIEREMGSAYRINGKDARARDIKLLFEDAATGARSPALVRQGQIGEIVNAKPEQRRRILEDAAGIAGLHSRRHEAELRLRQATGNMERLLDVLGQMNSQVDSMKRQARQARRYKELSEAIRQTQALALHLGWLDVVAKVDFEEAALSKVLVDLGRATKTEASSLCAELEANEVLQPLRDEEATRGAVLHRTKVACETFENEATRTVERHREQKAYAEQLKHDLDREAQFIDEAADSLTQLTHERNELEEDDRLSLDMSEQSQEQVDQITETLQSSEMHLSKLNRRVAEEQAQRKSLAQAQNDREQQIEHAQRQLSDIKNQVAQLIASAPDPSLVANAKQAGQHLAQQIQEIEAQTLKAEQLVHGSSCEAQSSQEASTKAQLAASRLTAEVDTLQKLLHPEHEESLQPIVDQLHVVKGYEIALGAALGDDLDAPTDLNAPSHWRQLTHNAGSDAGQVAFEHSEYPLPLGTDPLSSYVSGADQLSRRLSQTAIVPRDQGSQLQQQLRPGQRLVSIEGDLWRWDGLTIAAHAPSAATTRLAERNKLGELEQDCMKAQSDSEHLKAIAAEARELHATAQENERELRLDWREMQTRLTTARDLITKTETTERESATRLDNLTDAKDRLSDSLSEAHEKLLAIETEISSLGDPTGIEAEHNLAMEDVAAHRASEAEARAAQSALMRESQMRQQRLSTITSEIARSTKRAHGADQQIANLNARLTKTKTEIETLSETLEHIDGGRQKLLNELSQAEAQRQQAADALITAQTTVEDTKEALRLALSDVAVRRENRARIEVRLESARERRTEHAAKIASQLDCTPDNCLALGELDGDAALPPLSDVERKLSKLQVDRDKMGGVNLTADDELERLSGEFQELENERLDLEQAVAKLHGAINKLNKEARGRLLSAFETVNTHFIQLFSILFEGGEARLELIESDDPLQSGLEIIARPPGKKPATLSLLSGGEQTLTALSLIFAVFLTNPSPICVLDEVDAPLDDANVDRFCAMMERMSADTDTRFLVITHHPMTMARMDRLFGVTMGEKGVSQLVSVDLVTAERMVDAA